MYGELTSKLTSNAFSVMCPNCLILLIKCCVSLTYDLVLGTYFLYVHLQIYLCLMLGDLLNCKLVYLIYSFCE